MYDLSKMVKAVRESGYDDADAQAKVCQDIVLKAISESDFSRSVTIKGGVVMRSLKKNIRRATQDMDIDFIRYSMSDPSIENFVEKMNCIEGIYIKRIGKIEELRQQDYYGKRVFVEITDHYGNIVESKIDLGVHKHLEVGQEEYCFDIAFSEEGASLLINSKEQMFVEKLRSLLKFGSFSTRYKDIYDMYYQCDKLNNEKLRTCFESYIFSDPGMRENDISDVVRRVKAVFSDRRYRQRVDSSDKRWLDDDIGAVFTKILEFLEKNAESEY